MKLYCPACIGHQWLCPVATDISRGGKTKNGGPAGHTIVLLCHGEGDLFRFETPT